MKFRATVTEFIGDRSHPQLKYSNRQAVIALAENTRNDGRLVIVLKAENLSFPRIIQMEDIRSFHKTFAFEGKISLVLDTMSFHIKAHPVEMLRFVAILDPYLKTRRVDKKLRLPNLWNIDLKMPKKLQEYLHITASAQVPSSRGFPRTLTFLTIENVNMVEFDSRILRLQHLRSLTLLGVGLKTIPNQLELLPNLNTLNLSGNSLASTSNWRWLCCSTLRKNLLRLDLSNNQIKNLPIEVCRLSALQELTLNSNQLKSVPNAIGLLKNLRSLLLRDNEIVYFPYNVALLRLRKCDYSRSRGDATLGFKFRFEKIRNDRTIMSLVDLAACTVVNAGLKYSNQEVPRHLCDYMDNAIACLCSKLVLPPTPNDLFYCNKSLGEDNCYGIILAPYLTGYRSCVQNKCSRRCF